MTADDRGREGSQEGVERWVRDGLSPSEDQIHRVVSGAVRAAEGRGPWAPGMSLAVSAGVLIVLALAGFAVFRFLKPGKAERRVPLDRSRIERITLTNVSGEVELLFPAGQPGTEPAPAGTREARPPCNALYNRGGVVVLAFCDGAPHYWIAGGQP